MSAEIPPVDEAVIAELEGLAKLRLDEDERTRLLEKLRAVLGYVRQLQAVDTEGVEATGHAAECESSLRVDEPGPCLGAAAALEMAPASRDGFFEIPAVLDRTEDESP